MKLMALMLSYMAVCLRLLFPRRTARNRRRKHYSAQTAPHLTLFEKFSFGFLTSMICKRRLSRIAIILKPAN